MARALRGWAFLPLLLGCGSSTTTAVVASPTPASQEVAGPAVSTQTAAVHQPSGMQWPVSAHGFAYRDTQCFDATGLDCAAHYYDATGTHITMYVYPVAGRFPGAPDPVEAEFRDAVEAIGVSHRNVTIEEEGRMQLDQEAVHTVGRSLVATGVRVNDEVAARTYLYVFQHGPWFIKFRASHPVEQGQSPRAAIERFVRDVRWPTLSRPQIASL